MKHVRFAVWGWCEMDETVAFISRVDVDTADRWCARWTCLYRV